MNQKFVKLHYYDYLNVRTVFTSVDTLSDSERQTLKKADQIIKLMEEQRAAEVPESALLEKGDD